MPARSSQVEIHVSTLSPHLLQGTPHALEQDEGMERAAPLPKLPGPQRVDGSASAKSSIGLDPDAAP
jgi:hypothetical protein